MKRRFHSIKLSGEFENKDQSILLISNHVSWWDGFWALYLNQKLFRRRFYFMMLEQQLRRFWFFKYCGGFSVNKKSKTIVESINHAAELLSHKQNLVLIFPQGKIQSMHQHQFKFEKGLEWIINKTQNPIQIVFVANIIDYLSNEKPILTMYYKEYSGKPDIVSMQEYFNKFYSECIEKQKQIAE